MSTEFAQRLLAAAQQRGALGAEVYITEVESQTWTLRSTGRSRGAQDLTSETATAAQVHLRLYTQGGRTGYALRAAADLGALSDIPPLELAEEALGGQGAPDPLAGPPPKMEVSTLGLSINDPRLPKLEDADREDVLSWNLSISRSTSPRIRPQHFALTEQAWLRVYASSRGALATEDSTIFQLDGAVGIATRPDRTLIGSIRSRHFADIASRPLGAELSRRLESGERMASMPNLRLPLVLEPHVVAAILPLILPAFDAGRLARGESFLAGRMGTAIGPAWLHLVDDATLTGGLATRAFDDRGVPPIPLPLVREGVASTLYLDPYQARQRDVRPTGHARADGGLWPGNLVVRPGNRTRNMLFAELGRYLTGLDLLRPPQLDVTTGRLTLDLEIFQDEVERTTSRVGHFRIDTNILDFFASITQMGSDQARHDAVDACTWVTEGLPLSML